jgi:lysophospholipase L1-like esterase
MSQNYSLSRRHATLVLAALLGCALVPARDPAMGADSPGAGPAKMRADRVLFLGNSITLHGPAAAIGWLGNWGMAASSQEKDYVHLLLRRVAEATGKKPEAMVENIADFERNYATYDPGSALKKQLEFRADLVILAIGENVSALSSEEAKAKFGAAVAGLLAALKKHGQPVLVVRSCFWPDPAKDEALRRACQEAGGIFVDISGLSRDATHSARSERTFAHAGVAGHPGDKGMKAIADALWKAIAERPSPPSP